MGLVLEENHAIKPPCFFYMVFSFVTQLKQMWMLCPSLGSIGGVGGFAHPTTSQFIYNIDLKTPW